MKRIFSIALSGMMLLATATEALAQQTYYIYKSGNLRDRVTTTATKMKADKETGKFNLYDGSTSVYEKDLSKMDQISKNAPTPVADMLDVVFLDNGTAIDISPRHMTVEKVGSTQSVIFSNTYQRNMVKFVNPWGGTASGYYKVNYESDQEFKSKLADGHTLECLLCASYVGTIADVEAKAFSSHEGGGTGIMVCTKNRGNKGAAGNNVFTFLPNTKSNGWCWATSGVTPASGQYYHVVGVFDKHGASPNRARIFINGERKEAVDASGDFQLPTAGSQWIGIGCDPSGSNAGQAWCGNIVLARVYDKELTNEEVAALWQKVNMSDADLISNVNFVSNGLRVKQGGKFIISGNTIQAGDKVIIRGQSGQDKEVSMENFLGTWYFTVPGDLSAGNYALIFKRGTNIQELGVARIEVITNEGNFIPQGTRVIAHRGDWQNGSENAQNSRKSLCKALENKYYGSECDVYITHSNEPRVIVNHDISLNGIDVTTAEASYFKNHNIKLSNSEDVPFLDDFLKIMKEQYKTSSTKLIIEIKEHAQGHTAEWGTTRGKACIDATVKLVDQYGMQDRVEYISFNLDYCKYIHQVRPDAHVAYLGGDKYPQQLLNETSKGVMGLDYTADTYRNNNYFQWVWEAHERGMTTNVWTIDDEATMREMANHGIDFITTNKPSTAQALYNATAAHYKLNSDLMLDVQFNGDNVTDASLFKRTVQKNGTVTNGYFDNPWNQGELTQNFCRVDYENDQMFKAALTDGHTFESIFCVNGSGGTGDFEKKWFSSQDGDGTGFILGNNSKNQRLSFIVKTQDSDNDWRWAQCAGVHPAAEEGTYYHVFGVYDKAGQKVCIYAKKMNSADPAGGYDGSVISGSGDAKGSIVLPYDGRQWIGIGADPTSGGKAEASGKWHVKRARIYDRAMTEAEVNQLWGK